LWGSRRATEALLGNSVVTGSWADHDGPMTVTCRAEAATALMRLAQSDAYGDRADAGQALARFADLAETHAVLLGLVLDGKDTFVTLETTRALLRRRDVVGLEIVARASATADDNCLHYIARAAGDVLGIYVSDLRDAVRICADLAGHDDQKVRRGAVNLSIELGRISPILYLTSDNTD